MLEHENLQELQHRLEQQSARQDRFLLWLVSTEFLADEDAARRMRCIKKPMCESYIRPESTYDLQIAASAFRRWRCVEVVLSKLRRMLPDDVGYFRCPDSVLCRAIIDAVHGELGYANGRIIRMLLRTGGWKRADCTGCGSSGDVPNDGHFRGGRFGWEPFRLAFVEQQQDRDQRETYVCM